MPEGQAVCTLPWPCRLQCPAGCSVSCQAGAHSMFNLQPSWHTWAGPALSLTLAPQPHLFSLPCKWNCWTQLNGAYGKTLDVSPWRSASLSWQQPSAISDIHFPVKYRCQLMGYCVSEKETQRGNNHLFLLLLPLDSSCTPQMSICSSLFAHSPAVLWGCTGGLWFQRCKNEVTPKLPKVMEFWSVAEFSAAGL